MVKISVELNGGLRHLIDQQAQIDGHKSRCAVIKKALNHFLAGSSSVPIQKPLTNDNGCSVVVALELSEEIVGQIDARALQDGHTNRSAVIRKAVNCFFAR